MLLVHRLSSQHLLSEVLADLVGVHRYSGLLGTTWPRVALKAEHRGAGQAWGFPRPEALSSGGGGLL